MGRVWRQEEEMFSLGPPLLLRLPKGANKEVVLPHGAFHAPLSLLHSPCFCHGLPLLSHFLSQLHHFPLDLLLFHLGLQGLPSVLLLYLELGLRQNGFLQGLFLPLQL